MSCGIEWGRHVGIAATCAKLEDAMEEIESLSDRLRLATVEIDALKVSCELQKFLDSRPAKKKGRS